jgi:ABC-type transport system involved in cytochrome c biogenesis permease subunit
MKILLIRFCFAFMLVFMLAFTMPHFVQAQESADQATQLDVRGTDFATLPVLHEGRLKPLDSFARIYLKRFSGRENLRNISAANWLAVSIFNPAEAANIDIFRINDPQILNLMDLNRRESRLYSLQDLSDGLMKTEPQVRALLTGTEPNQDFEPAQQSLIDLHENVLLYGDLVKSLSMILPLNIPLPAELEIETTYQEGATFLELAATEQEFMGLVQSLLARQGENPDNYSQDERALAALAFEYNVLRETEQQNNLLQIIPPEWNDSRDWISPWQSLLSGQGGPQSAAYLRLWQDMAAAYRSQDRTVFTNHIEAAFSALSQNITGADGINKTSLQLETLYRAIKPFLWAEYLYLAAFILLIVFFIRPDSTLIYKSVIAVASAGFVFHSAGLLFRSFILARPPVGSLYETLLFVSVILMILAFAIEYFRRKGNGNGNAIGGALLGTLIMLLIAPFIAPDGDHLETLVAVLNTNFWLATHVTIITAGYAICILAACFAHIYLFHRARGARSDYRGLISLSYKTALAGLLFTSVGTMLGGVWADQSWGRFWGWDPKENGALLIVLWLIWLTHARLGDYFSNITLAASIAFLNIIVAIAWFGVNLLSVGLHSYGFIDGIAWGLGLFCAAEIVIIGALWLAAFMQKRREPSKAKDAAL